MRQRFGGLKAGADFISAKETSLENQINSYARKDDTKVYKDNGISMNEKDSIYSFGDTPAENQSLVNTLEGLPNLKKGMVIYVKPNNAGTIPGRFYVYGSSNEWL